MQFFASANQQQVPPIPPSGLLVVESVTESEFHATNTTTHDVAMPAVVNSGDLLLVVWTNDNVTDVTTPDGWSVILDNATGSARATIFAKSASGTEGGTTVDFVTLGAERAVAHTFQITGWSGDLANIESAAVLDEVGEYRSCATLTPVFGTAEAVWIVSLHFSGTPVVTSFPATYLETLSSNTFLGSTGAQLYSCWKVQTVATDTPSDFTFDMQTTVASTQVTTAIKGAE